MANAIKSCPFCGSDALLKFKKTKFGNVAYVQCSLCDAQSKQFGGVGYTPGAEDKDDFWVQEPFALAIKAWNRRWA